MRSKSRGDFWAGQREVVREASRRMISRRIGAIVNVSSVAARKPGRGQSNYAASKGAIESFTKALAVELAPRGVRVNAVAPGVIETGMTEDLRAVAGAGAPVARAGRTGHPGRQPPLFRVRGAALLRFADREAHLVR